jgi:phosphatidylserine/phosphatidylglycerophosphate/cardiolipin synthase-like enzyme
MSSADRLDLGALKLREGFFLLRQPRVPRTPFQPRAEVAEVTDGYRHVFTYLKSPQTIKEAAIKVIDDAREKVFLASFLLGDTELLEALYRAADRLRGGVYVVSALDEDSLRRGLAETEADEDPDVAYLKAHNKRFEDMTQRGIAVRGHDNFHAKFVVADDRIALVSSANLETRAFDTTGENGAFITDQVETARLGRFFARLWASCVFEMPPGKAHSVQPRLATDSPCTVPVPLAGPGNGLIWTYPGEHLILDTLHDIIGRAERTLLLATFGLTGLTANPALLIEPLRQVIEASGPEVAILVRARNNMAGHRKDAAELAKLGGVTIYGDSLNHAKGVIADDTYGALFSANFDAKHGLDSGVEVGVRLDGTPALAEAIRYFQHAITHSDLVFDAEPTQRAADDRLGAHWRKPWPLESSLRLRAEDSCWQEFTASADPPVLYVQATDGTTDLVAGMSSFRLGTPDANGVRELSRHDQRDRSAVQLLQHWLTRRWPHKPAPGEPVAHGFCPALLERVQLHSFTDAVMTDKDTIAGLWAEKMCARSWFSPTTMTRSRLTWRRFSIGPDSPSTSQRTARPRWNWWSGLTRTAASLTS